MERFSQSAAHSTEETRVSREGDRARSATKGKRGGDEVGPMHVYTFEQEAKGRTRRRHGQDRWRYIAESMHMQPGSHGGGRA